MFFYSSSKLISCIPFPAKFSSRYKLMLPLIISHYYQNIKTGFKFFLCVCLKFLHHYFSFQIYTGRENGQEQGLAHRVVTDLLPPYQDTNIRVSMDNFYTGVPLLRELYNQGTCAAGTIRPNREHLPKDLLPKSSPLEKHNYRVAQQGS